MKKSFERVVNISKGRISNMLQHTGLERDTKSAFEFGIIWRWLWWRRLSMTSVICISLIYFCPVFQN